MSPRQSADAGAASASPLNVAAARAAAARLRRALERVGLAQLRDVRRLVRPAPDAAEREDPNRLLPRVDLSTRPRPNADHGLRVERDPLPLDLDLAVAAERHVHLLLAIPGVIVLREALQVRRQVHHLHPERLDSELRARSLERAGA